MYYLKNSLNNSLRFNIILHRLLLVNSRYSSETDNFMTSKPCNRCRGNCALWEVAPEMELLRENHEQYMKNFVIKLIYI